MRVLMVEDDPDMLDVTAYALRKYGYDVSSVTDGAKAVQRWQTEQPDVVLLDVNLPQLSGMEVCRQIRQQSATPIIMVTAHDDEDLVVEGFEAGADDYVSKPVSYRQLAMRIRAVMQRHTGAPLVESINTARAGDISVDLEAHEVRKAGISVRMTRLQPRILSYLASHAGRLVATDRLIDFVWNYDGGDSFALKTHICHIRRKLKLSKGKPGYISSLPQVGYTLEAA